MTVDVFEAMSEVEWEMLCRFRRTSSEPGGEHLKASELTPEERKACDAHCASGFMARVKVGGHWWFVDPAQAVS